MKKILKSSILIVISVLLMSCQTYQKSTQAPKFSTKFTSSVQLTPLLASQQTVFVNIKNDEELVNAQSLQQKIKQAILSRGYQVMPKAHLAHYQLTVHVVQGGPVFQDQLATLLNSYFGGSATIASNQQSWLHPNYNTPVNDQNNMKDTKTFNILLLDIEVAEAVKAKSGVLWNRYQTRLIVSDNQPNMIFAQEQRLLYKIAAISISGLFQA